MARQPVTDMVVSCPSCKCGLGLELRHPSLNHFIGDVLTAIFDGLDRKAVDHVKDVGSDPFRNLKNPAQ